MEMPDRTAEQTDEMIHAAHASRYHWGDDRQAGEPGARRVAVLARLRDPRGGRTGPGTPVAAWRSARRTASATGTSRSPTRRWPGPHLTAGDPAEVAAWKAKAQAALDLVDDADDREPIEGDLATLP